MAALDEVTYPTPMAEELDAAFTAFTASRPWLVEWGCVPSRWCATCSSGR